MTTHNKQCFVPGCANSSEETPRKIFLTVPANMAIRRKWYEALNIQEVPSARRYCCEDHFNLEQDAENWQYYKTVGGKIKIRSDAVPRMVTPRKRNPFATQLSTSARKRKEAIQRQLKAPVTQDYPAEPVPGTSGISQVPSVSRSLFSDSPCYFGEHMVKTEVRDDDVLALPLVTPTKRYRADVATSPSGLFTTCTKGVQYSYRPSKRSVGVEVKTEVMSVSASTSRTRPQPVGMEEVTAETSGSEAPSETVSEEYKPSSKSSEDSEDVGAEEDSECSQAAMEGHKQYHSLVIRQKCKTYLGLPKDVFFLVAFCAEEKNMREIDILVTLKKIKTNDQYSRLADDFCISASYVGKIFARTVPLLAAILKELIFWPSPKEIRRLLPIGFRSKYWNVQTIIDCFEIAIEKPTKPTTQALTWSDYYQANTIKYMVSSTPNGIINFVSCGFGGRTSDKLIVENSGFLNVLPNNCSIMADRGFKHINNALSTKGCILVRPPSVEGNAPLSKAEAKEGKRIAALRIHIERVIGRVREFAMLLPYAYVDHNLIYLMDYVVLIVCGLLNVHHRLIK